MAEQFARKISTIFILFVFFLFSTAVNAARPATLIVFWHSMSGNLGKSLNTIVKQFNGSHADYQIIPIYKGNYSETLTATIAAMRAKQAPDIVQIFEVGTNTMIHPAGLIIPITQLMKQTNTTFRETDMFSPIHNYYADAQGNLLAFPFNSSTAVMFYNKSAFAKAGLDPNQPPRTWPQMAEYAGKLLKAGYSYGFTTGWPAWIQIESFSAWHNLPLASQNNGFSGVNATLELNNPTIVRQIATLGQWQKQHIFQYSGREDAGMPLFTSGQCPILMESSGALPDLIANAKFPVGIAALPYWPDVPNAPQNAVMGGAALWVPAGHSPIANKGIAEFIAFLAEPSIQAKWAKMTSYLPITHAAYRTLQDSNYYQKNPGADVAMKALLNKPATNNSQGSRLGNYMAIRDLINQQLEATWSGNITAQAAANNMVQQGNVLLQRFSQQAALENDKG